MATTSVEDFYSGKNILITGGSGFVGVCLLEKILRTIPNHGEIFLLLRPKRGKEIEERLETIKKNSVFEELLKSKNSNEVFKGVRAIAGDVGIDNLGLSLEDKTLMKEKLNVIFHSAATLDFGQPLKDTVNINLLGTRRITDLAQECPNLQVLVHVSSAYANSFELNVDEKLYPLTRDLEELIKIVNELSSEELEKRNSEILGDHPNSYTITKHMAEHEIQKIESIVPCAIVRPSMIVCASKEPAPGWTISKNGPQGFILGAAKGVIRRLPIAKHLIYDYIPVDLVVNNLITAGFHAATLKSKQVEVYHATSSTRKPFRWADVEEVVNETLHKYPLKSAVWYPILVFVQQIWLFKLSSIFVHFIPAFFLDMLLRMTGGRAILWRLHSNVNKSLDQLSKFIFTEWKFDAKETEQLHSWLSTNDQKVYNLSLRNLVWLDTCISMVIGAKVYLSNEPLITLEASRRKNKRLMLIHYGLITVWYGSIWIGFSYLFNMSLQSALPSLLFAHFLQKVI